MDELQVEIVNLEPMRVAAALGYGTSPELEAWGAVLDWARAQGLGDDWGAHRFFGFNNPNPSAGSPNYGYEQWMTVDQDALPSATVEVKEFAGGRFATTRCRLSHITATWLALVDWVQNSQHQIGDNVCLEECLDPPATAHADPEFALYLPVEVE
jgi:DNA gyrase inhibitor GyrI